MRVLRTVITALVRPLYALLAIVVGAAVFTASTILIPNRSLVTQIIGSESMSLLDELSVIFQLYGSITTNFTALSASVTLLLSVLVGINIALFAHAIRLRSNANTGTASATSVGGLLGGLFGIGCAACGSLLITAALPGVLGTAITALPFGGEEIGIVGIVLVSVSIYYIAHDIMTPAGTCPA